MIVYVNGVQKEIYGKHADYELICIAAYGKLIEGLTCTWFEPKSNGKGGTLYYSKDNPIALPLVNGMVFDILDTSAA